MPSNTLTWCKSPAISNPLYFQKNNGITLIYTNIFKIVTILSGHCKGESSSVNTFVMYPPKPLSNKVLMSLLTVLLALGATFGNGSILAVIARFKSFRTVPNTLLANLAVVDMLNIAINMPIYMISVTLEAGWFRGQSLAIMSSFFNRLLIILNLASMLALMADMYFAMAFDLKYFVWKSTYVQSCGILVYHLVRWHPDCGSVFHSFAPHWPWWRSSYWIQSKDLPTGKVLQCSVHGSLYNMLWNTWFSHHTRNQKEEKEGEWQVTRFAKKM